MSVADDNLKQLLAKLDEMSKPLNAKLERIEEKMSSHATKDDVLRLREEMTTLVHQVDAKITNNYVNKELYEARHAQLIQRDTQLDTDIRSERTERDILTKELRDRQQQIEDTIDKKLKERSESELSSRDRAWIRASQVIAWVAIGLSIVVPILASALAHLQFH